MVQISPGQDSSFPSKGFSQYMLDIGIFLDPAQSFSRSCWLSHGPWASQAHAPGGQGPLMGEEHDEMLYWVMVTD